MDKKGLSLLEIIIATLLLAMAVTGLANVFVAGKRHIIHARARMAGGELGKLFSDPLYMQVRQGESQPGLQDGWDQAGNLLQLEVPPGQQSRAWQGAAQTLDGIAYTPNYIVSRVRDLVNVDTGLRRVRVDINWLE